MSVKPYLNQVYEDLKKECLKSKKLFTDPHFPANNQSIRINYEPSTPEASKVSRWVRAKDLVDNPRFIVDDINRNDLDQGALGDCWFISSVGALVSRSEYRKFVIPEDQEFDDSYCGIFHFRFWQKGVWVDVVIDDFLPINSYNQLVFLNNFVQKNELWSSLLEKAYAKLYYSYDALQGGWPEESLTDMTGGVTERFNLDYNWDQSSINALWKLINNSFEMGSFATTAILKKSSVESSALTQQGLVDGHAYTVTGLNQDYKIIRIRNPHGCRGLEWNGEWSDQSNKWNSEIRKKVGALIRREGEFWMPFEFFLRKFDLLTLVHLNFNAFTGLNEPDQVTSEWNRYQVNGECFNRQYAPPNYQDPQHVINVDNVNANRMIIALMSTNYIEKKVNDKSSSTLAFYLYKVRGTILKKSYTSNEIQLVGQSDSNYWGGREITKRFRVTPGIYVVIPINASVDPKANYLLRVFTNKVVKVGLAMPIVLSNGVYSDNLDNKCFKVNDAVQDCESLQNEYVESVHIE